MFTPNLGVQRMPLGDVLRSRYVHHVDDVNDVSLGEESRGRTAFVPTPAALARLVAYMSTTAIANAGGAFAPSVNIIWILPNMWAGAEIPRVERLRDGTSPARSRPKDRGARRRLPRRAAAAANPIYVRDRRGGVLRLARAAAG